MTGHDLDLDAIRSVSENGNVRANRDQVRALCAEVESLRAKLAAAEQERDNLDRLAADRYHEARQLRTALAAVRELADHAVVREHSTGRTTVRRELYVRLADMEAALAAAEQDESDADIYETAAHRLANDDGRRFTLDEISREFEHEPKREQIETSWETRVEYGHWRGQTWVPEWRGVQYASHQRTVHFRADEPVAIDHWTYTDHRHPVEGCTHDDHSHTVAADLAPRGAAQPGGEQSKVEQASSATRRVSKTTELWTRRNASSGDFSSLRSRGVTFRGARSTDSEH